MNTAYRIALIFVALAAGSIGNAATPSTAPTFALPQPQTQALESVATPLTAHDIALVQAGRDADLAEVKIQLNAGANVNAVNGAYTALTGAAAYGNFTLVAYLLSRGADPNLTPPHSPTPLAVAVETGSVDLADALIRAGAKVNQAGALGETPLMRAAIDGNLAMTRLLIKNGAALDQANDAGETALSAAADSNHGQEITLLIAKGANVNAADPSGFTSLIVASAKGNLEAMQALIRGGAKVDAVTALGETALMHAVAASPAAVQALIAAKADVNIADAGGRTALIHAAFSAKPAVEPKILGLLLAAGTQIDTQNQSGQTALMYACASEQLDGAAFLLEKGANSNVADNQGTSALFYLAGLPLPDATLPHHATPIPVDASAARQKLAARLANSPTESADSRIANALCIAAGSGRLAVVKGILDTGATVDARADHKFVTLFSNVDQAKQNDIAKWPTGMTALMVACAQGNNDIVKELLQRGASRNAIADDGRSAADFATAGHHDATALLVQDTTVKSAIPAE